MPRKPSPNNPSCPHCGSTHVIRNGHKDGKQRWRCQDCGRSFGPTFGTAMYRLRTPPSEIARSLLVVMRRGSLRPQIRDNLKMDEAEAITEAPVHDLNLSQVDALWSFAKKGLWPALGMHKSGPCQPICHRLGLWAHGG